MRKIGKTRVLKMLADMEDIVKKLPEDARIGRLFVVDDGQGLILEKGIHEAAAVFEQTVKTVDGFNMDVEFLQFSVGALTIYQIERKSGK